MVGNSIAVVNVTKFRIVRKAGNSGHNTFNPALNTLLEFKEAQTCFLRAD